MMRDTLHFAFEYWDRGLSLIPLVGKRPPQGFGWKRYQTVRATRDDIRQWFRPSNEAHQNIGVLTGSISGITVVDCDTADDARWWAKTFPPTSLVSLTGRGGAHMFYRDNRDVRIGNRTHVLGRSIDIRGDGGYVVAPPSVHPETNRVYQWQPWNYTDYFCLDEIPVFAPAWLGTPRAELSCSLPPPSGTRTVRNGVAYIRHIKAVSGVGGHNATFRAASSLRDSGLSAIEALAALRAWNETNARPKWSDKDLAHKVEDAYQREPIVEQDLGQ